jgi:hypothetical protein
MGLRELVLEVISMRNAGKARSEIHNHIRRGALLLGQCSEHGDDSNFELRLVEAGEIVRFDGRGYSYRAQ